MTSILNYTNNQLNGMEDQCIRNTPPLNLESKSDNKNAVLYENNLEYSNEDSGPFMISDTVLSEVTDIDTPFSELNITSNGCSLQSSEENVNKEMQYPDDIEKTSTFESVELGKQKEDLNMCLSEQMQQLEENTCCTINQRKVQHLEGALSQNELKSIALHMQLDETIKKLTEQNISMKCDLLGRLENLTKQYEMADRDKQSMVIKYASSEKEVIIAKKQLNKLDKELKDVKKDKETLQKNNRSLIQENTKKSNAYNKKVQEYGQLNRQIDKLREELNARDVKSKWREHKLQAEVTAHQETQLKLDRELTYRKTHEDEMASVKREAALSVATTKGDELSRANLLDKLHNEAKANLIMVDQKNLDLTVAHNAIANELHALNDIYSTQEDELSVLRKKVIKYEREREESEKLVTSLQTEITSSKINETNLAKLVSNSRGLSDQYDKLQKKYNLKCELVADLREKLNERDSEFVLNQKHENELLEFTQKISDKDAVLQSQLSATKIKGEEMQSENMSLQQDLHQVKNECEILVKQLSEYKSKKEMEVKKLSIDYETAENENSKLKTLVSDMKNELAIQQRKYQNIIKDSGKEVIKLKTKLEALEMKQTTHEEESEESEVACDGEPSNSLWNAHTQETLSRSSNVSSTTSLNNIDVANCSTSVKNYEEPLSYQLLLEKLLKLQRRHIRKEEKIEFLEEHMAQLVNELKRKSKILHYYFLKEEPGALSSCKSDDAKAQIMKKGGIMASVYGSSSKDDCMTLELSLEINKKMDAVLEDTLLKNITLKENLDTLSYEVAKTTNKLRA